MGRDTRRAGRPRKLPEKIDIPELNFDDQWVLEKEQIDEIMKWHKKMVYATKDKRQRGRPRWIPPPPQVIESLAATCATPQIIASILGVKKGIMLERFHECEECAEAMERGRAKNFLLMSNRLTTLAQSADYDSVKLDAVKFALSRGHGWGKEGTEGSTERIRLELVTNTKYDDGVKKGDTYVDAETGKETRALTEDEIHIIDVR